MDGHIHIPVFLANIVTICFFLLTTLSQSNSQQPNNNYTVCNRPFNCGQVSNIYYPFWGDNRPYYCGGSKEFKLHCEDNNQHTSIQISSQNFRVLEIDNTTYTMTLMRKDLVSNVCSPQFNDSDFSSSLFLYPKTMHNITIFYDCLPGAVLGGNNYTCPNDVYPIAFYEDVDETLLKEFSGLQGCKGSIQVPALQSVRLDPDGGIDALIGALSDGFEVSYIEDGTECITCRNSGGACGTNDTANYQFSCYCPDGSHASLQCSGGSSDHSSMPSFPIIISSTFLIAWQVIYRHTLRSRS